MICIIVYMYTILFLSFYYTTSIISKYSCDPKEEREETHKALADVLPKEKGQKKRPWGETEQGILKVQGCPARVGRREHGCVMTWGREPGSVSRENCGKF